MKLGIIGLPQSGKTTLYNALTGGDQPTTMSAGRIEVNTAVVDVPDPRVDRLTEIYKPKKTTYAKVPLVGAMQTAVSVLQVVMDRRIAFRLTIIVAGMLLVDGRRALGLLLGECKMIGTGSTIA